MDLRHTGASDETDVAGALVSVSNSHYPSSASAACEGAGLATEPGAGSFGCGSLLYYVTEIPTTTAGNLWGSMELSVSGGFVGQTTFGTATDLANTPEFEPGLEAYDLPASGVDAGGVVGCAP
ncbi:MAG: hypothetical protein KJO40_12550 [Deltaproteobacteria bacterium]|nr:hypothetical protein [Deltaproteobacteria bacterium]